MNKTYKLTVVVEHAYSPIRIRTQDVGVDDSAHIHRAQMEVTIPEVDGEDGIFGTAKITWGGAAVNLTVARGCWPTVAAGGCDVEWITGPQNWQGRIESGQINGFAVAERGHMSGVK